MNNELTVEFFESEGYFDVRELPDGTFIGKVQLMFTTAICMGLDRYGWEKRFCFDNMQVLKEQYALIKSGDDEPTGYIARRYG